MTKTAPPAISIRKAPASQLRDHHATLNLYAAKTQLSKLVDRAAAGEEIVIAKAGKPMAKLVPLERPKKLREPGFLKGKIWIADDFDEWPEDILASFEADIEPPEETVPDDSDEGRR